ncbi:MAG: nicotinate-nucleotide adenylyltransferase [Gemmatimonadaceae bacterium]
MRLGVLGGTFDPPHAGHLLAAVDSFEALKLERLLIVPAATQPLKAGLAAGASPAQRLAMTRLAFGGDTRFEVLSMEIDRGGLSYTADTLESVSAANPDSELVLVAGTDALATFDLWDRPERILELARIAGVQRDVAGGAAISGHLLRARGGVLSVTARRVDVSSSEIRRRLQKGQSAKGFVAESVERYIAAVKLYRSERGIAPRCAVLSGD